MMNDEAPDLGVQAVDTTAAKTKVPPPLQLVRGTALLIKLLFLVGIVSSFIMMPVKLETYEAGILGTVVGWLLNSLSKADNFHWGTGGADPNGED